MHKFLPENHFLKCKIDADFLPSSCVALALKGAAIWSVLLCRAFLYCCEDHSPSRVSIALVQQVGPWGQICSSTPKKDKNKKEIQLRMFQKPTPLLSLLFNNVTAEVATV